MYTVKQARLLSGKTQREIALETGVDVGTYRRVESNPGKATIDYAKAFCRVVGLSVDQIFFDTHSTESRSADYKQTG